MKLTQDRQYNIKRLTVSGWTDGDGSGHEGYNAWAYFDDAGTYLGPDRHGIEPLFDDIPMPTEQECYQWAKANQGFTGSFNEWLNMPPDERQAYEDGAAAIPTD